MRYAGEDFKHKRLSESTEKKRTTTRKGTRGKLETKSSGATNKESGGKDTAMEGSKKGRAPMTKEEGEKRQFRVVGETNIKTHKILPARDPGKTIRKMTGRNYTGGTIRGTMTTPRVEPRSGNKQKTGSGNGPQRTGTANRAGNPDTHTDHQNNVKPIVKTRGEPQEHESKQRPSDIGGEDRRESSQQKSIKETAINWNEMVEEEENHQSGVADKDLMGPDGNPYHAKRERRRTVTKEVKPERRATARLTVRTK